MSDPRGAFCFWSRWNAPRWKFVAARLLGRLVGEEEIHNQGAVRIYMWRGTYYVVRK